MLVAHANIVNRTGVRVRYFVRCPKKMDFSCSLRERSEKFCFVDTIHYEDGVGSVYQLAIEKRCAVVSQRHAEARSQLNSTCVGWLAGFGLQAGRMYLDSVSQGAKVLGCHGAANNIAVTHEQNGADRLFAVELGACSKPPLRLEIDRRLRRTKLPSEQHIFRDH